MSKQQTKQTELRCFECGKMFLRDHIPAFDIAIKDGRTPTGLCHECSAERDKRFQKYNEAMEREFVDMTGVFTPTHRYWNNFADRLEGPEGCNFRKDRKTAEVVWTCKGGDNKDFARAILTSMARLALKDSRLDIDVERTLKWFEWKGGGCDCEILWNIDPD